MTQLHHVYFPVTIIEDRQDIPQKKQTSIPLGELYSHRLCICAYNLEVKCYLYNYYYSIVFIVI